MTGEATEGGTERGDGGEVRTVTYCLLPADLAPRLHDLLRDRFADEPSIEVVVEQRGRARRHSAERRGADSAAPAAKERRRVNNPDGRRVGERRAAQLGSAAALPELPRRARRHLERISFVERVEPAEERLEDLDTARLVLSFQAADRVGRGEVFTRLYQRYFERVFGYLRVLLKDSHEAEDATQQVFVNVLEALPAYEHRREPFRAWLFVIARNRALGQLKKGGRLEPIDPAAIAERLVGGASERDPGLRALAWISDQDLLLFVERLPLVQRQVLLLRYVFDLPHAEVAKLLERSPEDVRTIQRRAIAFLRGRLESVGRTPRRAGRRTGMLGRTRQAYVLRRRRFALRD